MRGGLDRLQKEMDALTYNSRAVLNALIRSTVVSGSSKGFTAKRVGYEIVLTRIDIYRLYRFYQEWEVNDYSTIDVSATQTQSALKSFDTIRLEQDATPVIDDNGKPTYNSTTDALVKHSKLLYLSSLNVASIDDTEFWVGLISDSDNPKLVSNSAPIPINLRTPVFDENLATTRFNQHPTYLFPSGYYKMDCMGYSGDDTDHRADGKSWTIGSDSFTNIESPAIAMGTVISGADRKTAARRNGNRDSDGDLNPVTYSLAWGIDTHARGIGSTAGGAYSMVSSSGYGSVAIGSNLLVTGGNSGVIGGRYNMGIGNYIGVVGGYIDVAGADYSGIVAGINNSTGGIVYQFTFPVSDLASSDCEIIDTNNCLSNSSGSIGRNQIAIPGNVVSEYSIGDVLRLFNFTITYNGSKYSQFYDVHGDAINSQALTITSIEYVSIVGNLNYGKTLITLSNNVAGGASYIDGGSVVKYYDVTSDVYVGKSSFVTGTSNIAVGESQAVVGRYNYLDVNSYESDQYAPLFIVGAGSASTGVRSNAMEVWEDFINLQATPRSSTRYGSMADYSGMEIHPNYIMVKATNDGGVLHLGNTFKKGTEGDNRVFIGYYNGTGMYVNKTNTPYNVRIRGNGNGIKIYSGAIALDDTGLNTGTYQDDILIASGNYIDIRSEGRSRIQSKSGITLSSNTDVSMDFANLILYGNTFGALPTNNLQLSHSINRNNYGNYVISSTSKLSLYKTGFYYYDSSLTTSLYGATDADIFGVNVFTANTKNTTDSGLLSLAMSTKRTDGRYDGAELFTTGYIADNDLQAIAGNPLGHIAVRKFAVDADGTYRASSIKQLAWMDDINIAIQLYTDAQDAQQANITWNSISTTVTELSLNNVGIDGTFTYDWTKADGWDSEPPTGTSVNSYVTGKYIVLNGNVMILNLSITFPDNELPNTFWTYASSLSVKLGNINYSVNGTAKQVSYSTNDDIASRFIATLTNKQLTITQTGKDFDFENTTLYFTFIVPVT